MWFLTAPWAGNGTWQTNKYTFPHPVRKFKLIWLTKLEQVQLRPRISVLWPLLWFLYWLLPHWFGPYSYKQSFLNGLWVIDILHIHPENRNMALQFEVCRFINTQNVLKFPFQMSKKIIFLKKKTVKTVLKIIFSTVLAFSRDFAIWKGIFSTLCESINLQTSNCNEQYSNIFTSL